MGQAENLLNSLNEGPPHVEHTVADPDSHFVIDPETRRIVNAGNTRNVLMQYDHNSEIYTFEFPRLIENHDMTLCNRVLLHYINIDGNTGKEYPDVVELTDMAVSEDNPEIATVSWLISRHATQAAGTLNFLLQFMCIDENGNVDYEWHTDIYDEVYVNPSRNNGKQVALKYSNILEQWRQQLFGAGNSIIDTAEDQIEAIVTTGNEIIEAIRDESANVVATVEDNVLVVGEITRVNGIGIDETLSYGTDDVLRVNTTNEVAPDNDLPITSAGVYNALGVIENGSY